MKHFTATTYLFTPDFSRTLFLYHKKLASWLPPGGHIEENESPEEAARREIKEEIGDINPKFILNSKYGRVDNRAEYMLLPHHLIMEKIEENHYHMDFIFYAVIAHEEWLSPENLELRWFTYEEMSEEKNIFENVREMAEQGFQLIAKELNFLK